MFLIQGATVVGLGQDPSQAQASESLSVLVEGGQIVGVSSQPPASLLLRHSNVELVAGQGCFLTPGLIDTHIHGGLGCDWMNTSVPEIHGFLKALPQYGITSILPTLLTASFEAISYASYVLEEAIHLHPALATQILGLHLEGPFLSPHHCGAHPSGFIRQGSIADRLAELQRLCSPSVKLMTMAPEEDPDGILIAALRSKGIVVSAGHTHATFEEMARAVTYGVTGVTHLYNAMRPFHHRDPGIIGFALNDPHLFVELLADGLHVHPEVIRTTLHAKGFAQVLLSSDCLALAGLPEGSTMQFGGQTIISQGEAGQCVAMRGDGVLAGSAMFLNQSFQNMLNWGLSLADAIQLTSTNTANYLGYGRTLGKIAPGYQADLVLWEKDPKTQAMVARATWVKGQLVYSNHPSLVPL